jgi:hypothetical protein
MRLTSVVLSTSDLVEEIIFSLDETDPSNRYLARAIVGIDAEEIIPKFYALGAVSGRKMYEFTMKPREIVARVSLNPMFGINEDVSDIRDAIYRLISANRFGELVLQFRSGSSIVSGISGLITKMEVPYFTRSPELQITIQCNDPMFRSVVPASFDEDDLPSANPIKIVDDASTAPHGFSLKVKFTATTTTFAVQDDPTTPDWKFEVTPSSSFLINDELEVSSEYGNKRVFLNRAIGSDIELMDKVVSGSVWPQIFPGPNVLYFPQIANFDWLEITHNSAFWGV